MRGWGNVWREKGHGLVGGGDGGGGHRQGRSSKLNGMVASVYSLVTLGADSTESCRSFITSKCL